MTAAQRARQRESYALGSVRIDREFCPTATQVNVKKP
jgi:hypothetical protein